MDEQADVVVIGMGVGGEEVAERLADAGLRVVGIERELVGGECPYWGCIPSKMMIRAANLLAEARRIPGIAGSVSGISPDWAPVAERIRKEATDTWDDTVAVERFTDAGGPADWFLIALVFGVGLAGTTILIYALAGCYAILSGRRS